MRLRREGVPPWPRRAGPPRASPAQRPGTQARNPAARTQPSRPEPERSTPQPSRQSPITDTLLTGQQHANGADHIVTAALLLSAHRPTRSPLLQHTTSKDSPPLLAPGLLRSTVAPAPPARRSRQWPSNRPGRTNGTPYDPHSPRPRSRRPGQPGRTTAHETDSPARPLPCRPRRGQPTRTVRDDLLQRRRLLDSRPDARRPDPRDSRRNPRGVPLPCHLDPR